MIKMVKNRIFFKLFTVSLLLFFISSCGGITPTGPTINSFTAGLVTITAGESSTLSWSVNNATSVTINQGVGTVALSGSTSVSPTTTTTYTLIATNSVGSSTATIIITVNPVAIEEQTSIIQPGSEEGKDSFITDGTPSNNWSHLELLCIGNNLGYRQEFRAYLRFDLSALPDDAVITSAFLKLYQYETLGSLDNFMISLYRVIENWEENTIIWINQPTYHATHESTISIIAGETNWLSWDINSLLTEWLNGSVANHGLVLKASDEELIKTYIKCYSSDYNTDPTLRPKLKITYYIP